MSEESEIPQKLRRLRERTGLSVRDVAEKLDWPASTYSTYEGRYKKPYLPPDKARAIADVFQQFGVPAAEVLALAGLSSSGPLENGTASRPDANMIPVDYLEVAVRALAEHLQDHGLVMQPADQGKMVATLCRWYREEVIAGRQPQVLSLAQAKSGLALLRLGS